MIRRGFTLIEIMVSILIFTVVALAMMTIMLMASNIYRSGEAGRSANDEAVAVMAALEGLPARYDYRVICGSTGSGKSRLLQVLRTQGAQVLDLEALANHRGSVLGLVPGQPQPSQKAFETGVWQTLRSFDPARVVYAEGESRTIGRLRVPEPLLVHLRAAACVQVQMTIAARVDFLLDDYAHFVDDAEIFCERLQALRELRGAETIERWQQQARAGAMAAVVEELLTAHYDPVYLKSMQRNFSGFAQAPVVRLADASADSLRAAAQALVAN